MSIPFPRAAMLAVALLPYLATAAPLSLEETLGLAARRSETMRAANAGAASAMEAARSAAQLPDPTLRVGIDNLPATGPDRFRTTGEPMTMKRIGLSQEWLSAGKRAARQAAADAAVERETVRVEAAAADTRRQAALAYVDAFYAGESLKLARLMEHHAREELEASRARLSSATGSSQEALALTGARGASEDDTADVLQQQGIAAIAFERWTGVAPEALEPPDPLALPSEPDYVAAHPAVAAMRRDLDVARRSADVTASEREPNWTWEIGYGQRTGRADMVSVGLSIPLPVAPAERQDRNTAAMRALATKAEADLAEAIRAATAEYRSLRSEAQRLEQRIDRYRAGVLVPAGQRTTAATASYRSGQGSLVGLFEARHAEVEARRKLLALQRDLARTQVQLAFRPLAAEVAR